MSQIKELAVRENHGDFVLSASLEDGKFNIRIELDKSFQPDRWNCSMRASADFVRRLVLTPTGLGLLPPQN